MILLLRVFGVFAAIGTLIYAIALIVTLTTPSYSAYVAAPAAYLAISAGFTWLWFWLAAKLSKRRHQAWVQRMALPCQQCGSRAAIGYRICSTCGRVKAAGV